MTQSKFTRGEWGLEACRLTGALMVTPEEGMHTHDSICLCFGNKANAHLIAAAPEMYEMLDSMSAFRDSYSGDELIQYFLDNPDDIERLLAKARGE